MSSSSIRPKKRPSCSQRIRGALGLLGASPPASQEGTFVNQPFIVLTETKFTPLGPAAIGRVVSEALLLWTLETGLALALAPVCQCTHLHGFVCPPMQLTCRNRVVLARGP